MRKKALLFAMCLCLAAFSAGCGDKQTEDELKKRYAKQLELYADALCRIFSTKEHKIEQTENLIYSFCFNKVIEL